MPKKYAYMHTKNEYRAMYEKGKQICFALNRTVKLVPTLRQIKKEQKLSLEWRKRQGMEGVVVYSYIRVEI